MEFNPNNPIIQLCIQGMTMEEKGDNEQAGKLSLQAWNQATNDLEKYLAAYYIARHQQTVTDKLQWLQAALSFAQKINDDNVTSAFPSLYNNIAKCYEELHDTGNAKKHHELAASFKNDISDKGPFYHGTRVNMPVGGMLVAGFNSNYKSDLVMNHIYFTANINGAGLAAALAQGEGAERVYIVEPTGSFEHDPNVTDKKFPGNPTRSYRTEAPLKIIGEVKDWTRITPAQLQQWKEKLANSKGEIIN